MCSQTLPKQHARERPRDTADPRHQRALRFHYLDPPDSEVTKRNWLGFYDPQRWRTLTPAQQHLNVHMLCLLHMAERRLLDNPRNENLQQVYVLRDLTGRRVLDMRQALRTL